MVKQLEQMDTGRHTLAIHFPYIRLSALKMARKMSKIKMKMLIFWIVTPYRLVGTYQCFGETYYLHLQGWAEDGDMFLRNVGIYLRVY
jgi:hypothetical protein